MRRLVLLLLAFALLAPNTFVSAQEGAAPEEVKVEEAQHIPAFAPRDVTPEERASLWPVPVPAEESQACFPEFDSVRIQVLPEVRETVPGADMAFKMRIRNQSEVPLNEGVVYLRIFEKEGSVFLPIAQVRSEAISLTALDDKPVDLTWHVPENAGGAEYAAAAYFVADQEHLLMGSYFSNALPESHAAFRIVSDETGTLPRFDWQSTQLSGRTVPLGGYPVSLPIGEQAAARTGIFNPGPEPQDIAVSWKAYAWDDFSESRLLSGKSEIVRVSPNARQDLSFDMGSHTGAVTYVVVTARDRYGESRQAFRFLREGISETRLSRPLISQYPLWAGTAQKLSVCALSLGQQAGGEKVTLALRGSEGEAIHAAEIELASGRNLQPVMSEFTPENDVREFVAGASVARGTIQLAQAEVTYACADPAACPPTPERGAFGWLDRIDWKAALSVFLIGLAVIGFLAIAVRKARPRRMLFFLALIALGGLWIGNPQPASAASNIEATWARTPYVLKDYLDRLDVGRESYCPEGWSNTGLTDDEGNRHHLGEQNLIGNAYQLCLRSTVPGVTVNAGWTTGVCPAGTSAVELYDDAGDWGEVDDEPIVHNVIEEKYRPDGSSAYRWCLGASGRGATLSTRWIMGQSSEFQLPCSADEARLVGAWFQKNLNTKGLGLPWEQSALCAQITVAANQPPSVPSLSGPAVGVTNTPYPFTAQASDPESDLVRYGFDWDNNGSVDEWTGFAASGAAQSLNHQWISPGDYTLRVLAQDNSGDSATDTSGWSAPHTIRIGSATNGICGLAHNVPTANPPTAGLCNATATPPVVTPGAAPGPYSWTCTGTSGGSDAACFAPHSAPLPNPNLRINGSDGPLTVPFNAPLNITWDPVTNAASCTGSGPGWDGPKNMAGGNDTIAATASAAYQLTCTGPSGTVTDTVLVSLSSVLKICENSCNSGINPPSFTMAQGATKNLVACWNASNHCDDSNGNVTNGGTNWSESGGSTISLSGSDPKVVTATGPGTESVSASYGGQTVTKPVTVACIDPGACARDARQADYCTNQTFSVTDTCGQTQSCRGTKSCDFNWREVAP